MSKKVVIIGSGMGGLSCAIVLAKNGYDVTVLEQGVQSGGCLQCFKAKGAKFETGMHFVGSADRGQILDKMMRYIPKSILQALAINSQFLFGIFRIYRIEGRHCDSFCKSYKVFHAKFRCHVEVV